MFYIVILVVAANFWLASRDNALFSSAWKIYHISGIMVSMLALSVVDRGFKPQLGQTKDYKIGICCFSTKHAALKRKSTDWLIQNQNNVYEWSDMSTRRLLFQWTSTIKNQTQHVGLVQSGLHHHLIDN